MHLFEQFVESVIVVDAIFIKEIACHCFIL